jgi:hypothetical protein
MGKDGNLSFLNYKNNAQQDSVLSTDENGKVIMKKITDIDVLQATDSSYLPIKKLDGTIKNVVILGGDGESTGASGGSGTLQQAFDAAPTAFPQINAHGVVFLIDSAAFILSPNGVGNLTSNHYTLEHGFAQYTISDTLGNESQFSQVPNSIYYLAQDSSVQTNFTIDKNSLTLNKVNLSDSGKALPPRLI